jgi:hypothetical protein
VTEFTVTLAYYRFLSGDTFGNYDDLDEFLSIFGLSAQDIQGFGQISSTLGALGQAGGSVLGAARSLGNLF